jgi:hypothetical protein
VFSANAANKGGGLANQSGATATVRDSVFTGNSAAGTFPHGDGGGLANEAGGTVTVTGSTFTGNTAGSGNGGLNNEPGALLTQFDNQFINDLPPDVFP